MNNHVPRHERIIAVLLLLLVAGWGISQADEAPVDGVYSLMEVNGEQLPAVLSAETSDGGRCEQVILKGALLLDSEGRSAAFLTVRESCRGEADQGPEGAARSTIFTGTYSVSDSQIIIEDDFGTDHATVEGDVLVYETGGEGRPIERFVFRKD